MPSRTTDSPQSGGTSSRSWNASASTKFPPHSSRKTCLFHTELLIYPLPTTIRVSLLTNFENGEDYLDWTVGTHGIQITFQHPFYSAISGSDSSTPVDSNASSSTSLLSFAWSSRPQEVTRRKYSATYLPDVMPAQQWTKLQAIDSAIRKAGWDGKITDELRRGIQLRRYQSSKTSATWEEYVQWREEQGLSVRV